VENWYSWNSGSFGNSWSTNGGWAETFNPNYAQIPGTWDYYIGGFLTFSSSGSMGLIPAISGPNPNDYEVNSTLGLKSGYGTYINFMRASSTSVVAGQGSYISAEIVMPASFQQTGTATLNINQCVNGTVTRLAQTEILATDGMQFRTVVFGTNLWVFLNDQMVAALTIPLTTGNPLVGGYGMPAGSGFALVQIGHHDTVAPFQVAAQAVASSVLPNLASLKWKGVADDTNGIGVFGYYVSRNGGAVATVRGADFADSTVSPSTTYTYTIQAVDYHGNAGTATNITVTTPPAQAIDPRRVGLFTTGSYWGGGGEQIDTLSGNLNFSLPLVTAQQRTGQNVPVGLNYNSQNWRQDNGVNWQLGEDVGYGYGWQVQIGSITPYYSGSWSGVDHYVFTDATSAQYVLSVNNSGIWSSTQGVRLWFDSNAGILHFKDGSFWIMGSVSGGLEADAGTIYPTMIEEVNGNQIQVTYLAGAGLASTQLNTSSRIEYISDMRSGYCSQELGCEVYVFQYNTDLPVPHLTRIINYVGTAESYNFTYTENAALGPPFGTDPNYAGMTTTHLASITPSIGSTYQFTYDSAGASELLQVMYPWGGHLRWTYANDAYNGSRTLRAVSGRYLAAGSSGGTEWSYGISRDNASSATIHATMTLADASGVGAKTWNFITPGSVPPWQIGLVSSFVQSASQGGAALQSDSYTWSQDPSGTPYISAKSSTLNPGGSNPQTALTTQTLDQYGNVTQSAIYPYNNSTTPVKSYTNTYKTGYESIYVFDRLATSSLNTSPGVTLVTNTYTGYSGAGYGGPTTAIDPHPPSPRPMLTTSATPAKTTTYSFNAWGTLNSATASDGTSVTLNTNSSTNYAAPSSVTTQSYSQSLSYNSWLGITQATGANGEQLAMTYDSYGRPVTGTSPYGATTTYSYSTSLPFTQTANGPNGITTTTLDGLGRAILVARGDSNGVQSYTQTVYAPCACSPLGKVQQMSQPYAPGASTINWTVYAYDGMGRTLSVTQPDGLSTTVTSYSGNQTTVTDPAGKSKTYTTDALGNLTTVLEPDPCVTANSLTTSYTYDWMNHVSAVSMTRSPVAYTVTGNPPVTVCSEPSSPPPTMQTRQFVYDNAGRLTSATNPENGTVTYTYNTDNTLQYKQDAKGQQTVYTYDSQKRVTMVQRFPNGQSNSEDYCNRVSYWYDTNPFNAQFAYNTTGRLTALQYGSGWATSNGSSSGTPCVWSQNTGGYLTWFTESYAYYPAGAVNAKMVTATTQYPGQNPESTSYQVSYGYDTAGRVATVTYPFANPFSQVYYGGLITFTYGYDTMGRPVSLTDYSGDTTGSGSPVSWVSNVQYDVAGRMTGIQYINGWSSGYPPTAQETMTYNANGQMSGMNWNVQTPYVGNSTVGITYSWPAGANNGQISQAVDTISGETITYQYDALKRLTSASSTPNAGSSVSAWAQTYQYDGFGNLTAKVLNGTSTTIAVNAATNQLTNSNYDLNGNMLTGVGATFTYDEANRVESATEVSGGTEYFGYSPDNKLVYRNTAAGVEEITFYGAYGEKLWNSSTGSYLWFAGRLIADGNSAVFQDRVGTNRSNGQHNFSYPYTCFDGIACGARYYPYGDEITSTPNERTKFGTYYRDSFTGVDYADQRWYASAYGRFLTPDPFGGSAKAGNPASWNRYSYALGDPVSSSDPSGLDGGDGCGLGTWASDQGVCQADYYDNDPDPADSLTNNPAGYLESTLQNLPIASATACATPGEVWTGTQCDVPIYGVNGQGAAIVQQTGQNMQGFNGLLGTFAGGSILAGAGVAAGMAGATASLPSVLGNVPASTFAGGAPSFQIAIDDIAVTRVTSTATNISGAWTTTETITSGSQATSILALPPSGGLITATTAGFATSGVIPAGSGYFTGIVAPLFGQIGGGIQIWGAPVVWGVTAALPWH
jgi:RHS repeat-associated protein